MKRVLTYLAAIVLTMGMVAPIAAQMDEDDCLPLPYLDLATECDSAIFVSGDFGAADGEMVIIIRAEFESKKTADSAFDEVKELSENPEEGTDEIPLKPTKEYKRFGIGDALKGEDDGTTVVALRDDEAIIVISGKIDDEKLMRLIEVVVDEDEIPNKFEDLEPFE